MKKGWGLVPKILSGEKTIESRWYKTKRAPWGKIFPGETVYFKNSGEPVTVCAKVKRVKEIEIKDSGRGQNDTVKEILNKYGREDGIAPEKIPEFAKLFADKKYCLLIYLKNPRKVKPFEINKRGFGAMAAWMTTKKIERILDAVRMTKRKII